MLTANDRIAVNPDLSYNADTDIDTGANESVAIHSGSQTSLNASTNHITAGNRMEVAARDIVLPGICSIPVSTSLPETTGEGPKSNIKLSEINIENTGPDFGLKVTPEFSVCASNFERMDVQPDLSVEILNNKSSETGIDILEDGEIVDVKSRSSVAFEEKSNEYKSSVDIRIPGDNLTETEITPDVGDENISLVVTLGAVTKLIDELSIDTSNELETTDSKLDVGDFGDVPSDKTKYSSDTSIENTTKIEELDVQLAKTAELSTYRPGYETVNTGVLVISTPEIEESDLKLTDNKTHAAPRNGEAEINLSITVLDKTSEVEVVVETSCNTTTNKLTDSNIAITQTIKADGENMEVYAGVFAETPCVEVFSTPSFASSSSSENEISCMKLPDTKTESATPVTKVQVSLEPVANLSDIIPEVEGFGELPLDTTAYSKSRDSNIASTTQNMVDANLDTITHESFDILSAETVGTEVFTSTPLNKVLHLIIPDKNTTPQTREEDIVLDHRAIELAESFAMLEASLDEALAAEKSAKSKLTLVEEVETIENFISIEEFIIITDMEKRNPKKNTKYREIKPASIDNNIASVMDEIKTMSENLRCALEENDDVFITSTPAQFPTNYTPVHNGYSPVSITENLNTYRNADKKLNGKLGNKQNRIDNKHKHNTKKKSWKRFLCACGRNSLLD